MAVLVTVNIDAPYEHVEQVEAANPDVMSGIIGAAMKYMRGHRRTYRDGFVMDIDEFDSADDYNAFIAEAGPSIKRYGELVGVAPRDTLWVVAPAPAPPAG